MTHKKVLVKPIISIHYNINNHAKIILLKRRLKDFKIDL